VGTSITISGSNFGATQGNGTVSFNGVPASVSSWSAGSIAATVPSGATSGNVVVYASGVNSNGVNFTVITLVSIAISPANVSLPLNSVQQYTATGIYSDNSQQNITTSVSWSSSNTVVADLSTAGLLTAFGENSATIQAALGSINGSTGITVTQSSFIPVGSLTTFGGLHAAALLQNNQVLVAGGSGDNYAAFNAAYLYDPTQQTFSPTGGLLTGRYAHTATLLNTGKVLIAGGIGAGSNEPGLATAELYDPTSGTFSYTGRMKNDHSYHTATLLNSGQVLIAGGLSQSGGSNPPAELYDPTSGTFSQTGTLTTSRFAPTATLLNDGTVLFTGGASNLTSTELYSPTSGTFAATGSLNVGRSSQAAAILGNGQVLVAGGNGQSTQSLSSAELYDPVAKTFSLTGSMSVGRSSFTATALSNGSALVVGGVAPGAVATGTAEVFADSNQTFLAAGSMEIPRDSQTATLLNDGTVLIVGADSAELYAPTLPKPFSLQVTPANVNMLVGGTQQFTVVANDGYPRPDATWMVSNTTLASIGSGSSPILTALASGTVTLTATIEGVSAQAQITIFNGSSLPVGTPVWSASTVTGFSAVQLAQATPSNDGPDLYSVQLSGDGTQTVVQALTADGQQLWQTSGLPPVNNSGVPDAFGGLLLTGYQTCLQNQTNPMTIIDLEPTSGQPLWQITAQPTQGLNGPVYCYPQAPQMAIRGDGSVIISAPGNTSGLPELEVVMGGQSTYWILTPSIPTSQYTQSNGSILYGYSPIGPPMVNTDGSAYVEYEVRDIAYPPKVTSASLYLLKFAPDNSTSTVLLSSTTQDENLFPGEVIPDGTGGILATWTISPSNPPIPTYPYQAADVVGGVVGSPYNLPFAPTNFVMGGDGPIYPSFVLGESGVAFATDGTSTGDSQNGLGPKIVSFNLSSGGVNWTYQVETQYTLSLIAAADGNGLAAKSTDQSSSDTVVRFDSSGNPSFDSWASGPVSDVNFFVTGDSWVGSGATNLYSEYFAAPVQLSTSAWYERDGNGANSAILDVTLTNFSKNPPNQTTITNLFQSIASALPSYSACNNWLQGTGKNQGTSGVQQIQGLLNNNLFGHATVSIGPPIGPPLLSYTISAFSGTQNPDGTDIQGLPSGAVMTVNDIGAFFNQTDSQGIPLPVGQPNYPGGSPQAQATILVHEIAHQITASGFQPDFGNKRAGKANDHLVNANCNAMINAQ
jgi:hypothetical protein